MIRPDLQLWLKRASEILAMPFSANFSDASEIHQFAISMLSTVYGPDSPQMRSYKGTAEEVLRTKAGGPSGQLFAVAQGAITNTKAEIEAGLIQNWRAQVAGELLAELVRLGKEVLSDKTDPAKNVGAVLIAAAFEGVLRRMGEEFAGVTDRPGLQELIASLKSADVLKGAQVHSANGYLKFRNDSLHADWNSVDRFQVESCILFLESLLEKHFS